MFTCGSISPVGWHILTELQQRSCLLGSQQMPALPHRPAVKKAVVHSFPGIVQALQIASCLQSVKPPHDLRLPNSHDKVYQALLDVNR